MGLARRLQPEDFCDPYGRLQRTTCLDQRCQIRPLHVCQKHVEWGLGQAYNFWIKLGN